MEIILIMMMIALSVLGIAQQNQLQKMHKKVLNLADIVTEIQNRRAKEKTQQKEARTNEIAQELSTLSEDERRLLKFFLGE